MAGNAASQHCVPSLKQLAAWLSWYGLIIEPEHWSNLLLTERILKQILKTVRNTKVLYIRLKMHSHRTLGRIFERPVEFTPCFFKAARKDSARHSHSISLLVKDIFKASS